MSNIANANNNHFLRIALTPGEPAGIGPDVALMLATEPCDAAVVHFADPVLLATRARELGLAIKILQLDNALAARPQPPGVMQVVAVATASETRCGELDTQNASYVLACLDRAIDACSRGDTVALVTGPINKAVINDAGIAFSGHTEYLAARLGAELPVMLLVAGSLRVALVTTHVALSRVPSLITRSLLEKVVEIVWRDLTSKFAIAAPRICVCGLNPHAGEQGHLGHEEVSVITPALEALRQRGWDIVGPLPADTAFTAAQRERFDVIVAMYHDQGLSALKALSFGDAINTTLGLPILRTSVDHGTALDRAGTGDADPSSLRAALSLAVELAQRQRHD